MKCGIKYKMELHWILDENRRQKILDDKVKNY